MTDQRRDCNWTGQKEVCLTSWYAGGVFWPKKSRTVQICPIHPSRLLSRGRCQFTLLLGFLLISHSIILGGFIYIWWVFTNCGESPVLFYTVGQDWPVPQVLWKLWCVTMSCHTCETGNIQESRYRLKMEASVLPCLRGVNQLPLSEIGNST